MVRLGIMYDIGKPPVEKDTNKANKLFAVAADRGDAEAMFYLAWGYYKGDGMPKDPKKGRELLEAAKAKGHARAAAVLADLDRNNA
jgi:TPR repeat protein